jgi:hypothetical protein
LATANPSTAATSRSPENRTAWRDELTIIEADLAERPLLRPEDATISGPI